VEPAHLPAYLNEFAFRFNRRRSRSRGLVFYRVLELATGHDPVRYDDIRAARKPRSKPPQQRGTGHPPSLNRPAAARPWRTAEMQLPFPLRLSGYTGADNRRSGVGKIGSVLRFVIGGGCCSAIRIRPQAMTRARGRDDSRSRRLVRVRAVPL
jgi:hypothetical protein